jgi:extradiol dioxygenase
LAVAGLGYIGIDSKKVDEWSAFAPEVLGLEVAGTADDGSLRLRMDDRPSRLLVYPGDKERLRFIGWEVSDPAALRELFGRLEAAGAEPRYATREECASRDAQQMVITTDPAGNRIELVTGRRLLATPFKPPRPISGFVTGELGMGHLVIEVPDIHKAVDFYLDVLGFRLSDQFGELLYFLRCNRRHHSIALANVGGEPRLFHIMLEVGSLVDVGMTFDVCLDRELPMSTMGLHANDRMTSFYLQTPSGFEVEYGWSGLLVDESTWTATTIERPSVWGHRQLDPTSPPGQRRFARLGVP